MGDFNNRGRTGGRRSFDSRGGSDRPQMHRATCSNCGKECEVPFRPNGSKPVLCSDCFKNGGGAERRNENRSFGRTEERQMFDAICSNCGNACQIPFQPRDGRPVFCSRCFEKNEGGESRRSESRSFDRPNFENRSESRRPNNDQPNYKAQFETLNAKMDKILSLLSPAQAQIVVTEPLESIIDEKVIDEIVEEIESAPAKQNEKEVKVKKAATKKTPVKKETKKKTTAKK